MSELQRPTEAELAAIEAADAEGCPDGWESSEATATPTPRRRASMADVTEFIQCDSRNYTAGRQGCAVNAIVVHYTGTSASAHNTLLYFSRSSASASVRYFVDKDGSVRRSVKESDTAWHAGHWQTNLHSIGIEVVSAGEDFAEAQVDALTGLVSNIRGRCGIAEQSVIRHFDVTGKRCPVPYVDSAMWAALKARICGGLVSSGGSASGPSGNAADLAKRVINGEFGNGEARKAALGSRYAEVQAEANRMLGGSSSSGGSGSKVDIDDLARRTINGEFGNGDVRKKALGFNYDAVQARVNEMLGGKPGGGTSSADIDALALAVIRGDYGNGDERKRRLGASYVAVQRRVNELLA